MSKKSRCKGHSVLPAFVSLITAGAAFISASVCLAAQVDIVVLDTDPELVEVADQISWRDGIVDLALGADGRVLGVGPGGLVVDVRGDTPTRVFPRPLTGGTDFLAVVADDVAGFWLGTRHGEVVHMDSAGTLTPSQKTGADGALFKLIRLADGSMLGVGEFGSVVTSTDGGQSWYSPSLPWDRMLKRLRKAEGDVVPHLYGVCESPKGTLYMVGENGMVFARTNNTWSVSRDFSGTGNLFACAVAPSGEVLAVGQTGNAVLLSEGSWKSLPARTQHDFFAVAWSPRGFVAVGDQGVAQQLKQPNGLAAAWHRLELGDSAPRWLSAILVDKTKILAGGSGGYVTRLLK